MKFIFLTLLIISGITYSRSDRYEVVGPADTVFAVAGEDVILPCSVKPNISVVDMKVRWSRLDLKDFLVHLYEDHEDRNTDQIQSYRGRTKLNHQELQRGNASLKLSSVQVSDEGRYKCFIQSKSWFDDATVDVSVEAVGRPPVITVDGFDHSERLRLQCESEGWYPEPVLEWLDSEGVSLSSETTEMQRNTDGFSVKHTITVQHRDDKIHCRVKLRHHMLETLIVTSSKSFNRWRTSIILSSVAVVLIVMAGILLAAFVRKTREHDELQNENERKKRDSEFSSERDQLQIETNREQQEFSSERDELQKEKDRIQQEFSSEYNALLQDENQKIKQEFSSERDELQREKNRKQQERDELQKEKNRILQELNKQKEENRKQQGASITKLNLVVCGRDGLLKASISKLISEKKDMELHRCLISLEELPALTGLSEEEVMRQTLHCVSLCHPGVHVFLLIIPEAPLNNEDKEEMEIIQRIFSSSIKNNLMILKIQDENMISKQISSKSSLHNTSITETYLQSFGGQCFILENSSQVPALLQDVENMVKLNNGSFYTTFMYLQDQLELERNKHRAEIEELRRSVMKTAGVTHNDDEEDDGGVRIVLMGKTGVGKSATGNTILRRKAFTSKLISRSVTRECQKETSEFNRRRISVIDTPGLFDTGVDNDEIRKEIVKCISMAAPGPHVFLLVIQLGRFTKEEKEAVKMIQESFGDQSRKYTMVLFTRGDDLRGTTIQDFIEDDGSLQNLINQCGKRYHVFNNNETEDQTQVSELLEKIDHMVAVSGGSFYTNEMFQQVEKNIREEQERILKEKEEEIKKKEEELRAKYEAELEQMKKENKGKKQEMKNELRKKENLFKMREEEIRKETDENLKNELKKKLEEQQKQFEEENNRKKKDLEDQQNTFMKHLEDKHKKEKEELQKRIQDETREAAEKEYREKLERELPNRSKRARDWSKRVPLVGGAAGDIVGTMEDIGHFLHVFYSKS